MTEVRCSWLGKLVGWLVQRTGALMPFEGKDVPVEIDVWSDASGGVHKRRTYRFPQREPFVFKSYMELSQDGRLAEHVGGGFGMYVCVSANESGLGFTDAGYFVQLPWKRVSLPALLTPGRVRLAHVDVAAHEFDITIDITHRLFGRLFWQRGRFRHLGDSAA